MKTFSSRSIASILAIGIIAGASACKDSTDAVVNVRVVENAIDQITQDTAVLPVAQAQVRFYNNERVGTLWLEEIIMTGANGEAQFVFPNPAILKYDVTHGGRNSLENFVILEQGKTIEVEVNLDEL
jgi:hypothetical protein